jgi:hypothetical protein
MISNQVIEITLAWAEVDCRRHGSYLQAGRNRNRYPTQAARGRARVNRGLVTPSMPHEHSRGAASADRHRATSMADAECGEEVVPAIAVPQPSPSAADDQSSISG